MNPLEQTMKDIETIYTCPNHGIITEEGTEIIDNDFNCPICNEPLDIDLIEVDEEGVNND